MINRRDFLKLAAGTTFFSFGHPKFISRDKIVKQDVILSFDGGTRDYAKMEKTFELSDELSLMTGKNSHFTFFLTSSLLFSRLKGKSNIGFGGTKKDIESRLKITQKAIGFGHEIGNHSVRHLHGSDWSYQQWIDELSEFDEQVAGFFADKNGRPYKAVGFRAPYLEWNEYMFNALSSLKYSYDVSVVGDEVRKRGEIFLLKFLYGREIMEERFFPWITIGK